MSEKAQSSTGGKPRFHHTRDELSFVVSVLDVLNANGSDLGFDGELVVYWTDCAIGKLSLDDSEDLRSWCYCPIASQDQIAELVELDIGQSAQLATSDGKKYDVTRAR